jgi:chromosome partitioning protein
VELLTIERPPWMAGSRLAEDGGTAVITAVVQEKGGVGKTTTVINLGAWYARMGFRTLLIDLDPQGSLAKGLGVAPRAGQMYRVFRDSAFSLEGAIIPSGLPNLDIAAADTSLEAAEVELIHALSRENVLRRKIDSGGLRQRYDRILVDCRPSLGVLTVNAMTASDRLLIPVETHYFAVEALQTLLEVVKMVRETLNPRLTIAGILPTKHEPRVRASQATLALLQERYPELLTETVIRKYVAYPEAQLRGVPICDIAPESEASQAYQCLAHELEGSRIDGLPQLAGGIS